MDSLDKFVPVFYDGVGSLLVLWCLHALYITPHLAPPNRMAQWVLHGAVVLCVVKDVLLFATMPNQPSGLWAVAVTSCWITVAPYYTLYVWCRSLNAGAQGLPGVHPLVIVAVMVLYSVLGPISESHFLLYHFDAIVVSILLCLCVGRGVREPRSSIARAAVCAIAVCILARLSFLLVDYSYDSGVMCLPLRRHNCIMNLDTLLFVVICVHAPLVILLLMFDVEPGKPKSECTTVGPVSSTVVVFPFPEPVHGGSVQQTIRRIVRILGTLDLPSG
jgi:hypothetical protein